MKLLFHVPNYVLLFTTTANGERRTMPKIPFYYRNDEFFNEFGTSCYINYEDMVDTFPLYRHDFMEISLILEGEGEEYINGVRYPVKRGCVSVTMPWHFHTLNTKPGHPIKRFICEFSMEDFLNYASIWPAARDAVFTKKTPSLTFSEGEFDECCQIFNSMYQTFTSKGPNRQTKLYLKLIEFMILFYENQQKHEQKSCSSGSEEVMEAAMRYIHQHFSESISIADAARETGINVSVLRDCIKAYTGMEFQNLLMDIRIRNACILLGLKTPTIKYIAQNTGFSSIQTFYRAFKEIKGITPEEFRKQHWLESEGKAGYLMYTNEIWNILYYVYQHFDEPLTPESVAQHFQISTSYLHKIIKYNLMETFSELLREIRINYSCGMLMNLDLSVTQIAIETGYNNTKTFSRAFQTQKGCTPSEYRASLMD